MARAYTLLLFYMILAVLAIEDVRKRKISNMWHGLILLLTLAAFFTIPEISLQMRILGMLAVSLPMAFIALFVPGSFGGGDVKLVFFAGAFLGWKLVFRGATIAILLAASYSLWLILMKKEALKVQFPLGPCLSVGFILSSISLF